MELPFEAPEPPTSSSRTLARHTTTALAASRIFRPALDREIGRAYLVEVVEVVRVGGDAIVACRERSGPWHFEVLYPRPIEVGDLGTVRCTRPYRTMPIRWAYVPDSDKATN